MVTVIGLGILVLGGLRIAGAITQPPPVGCINTSGVDSTTIALDKELTYKQPSLNADPTGLLILGCRIRYEGYCVGDTRWDVIGQVSDARWWKLSGDQGYLSGVATAGPAPSNNEPRSDCPSPRRHPAVLTATGTFDTKTSTVRMTATARDVGMIGFVVREGNGWRRVGWDKKRKQPGPVKFNVKPRLPANTEFRAVPCVGYPSRYGTDKAVSIRVGSVTASKNPFNAHQPRTTNLDAACKLPTVPLRG